MNPLDDGPRIDAADALGGEFLRLVSDIVSGPAGRLLRRMTDADGRPLVYQADAGRKVVWVPVAVVEFLRALRACKPAGACPVCDGKGCKDCKMIGFVTADARTMRAAETPAGTLPLGGDVSDVWPEW